MGRALINQEAPAGPKSSVATKAIAVDQDQKKRDFCLGKRVEAAAEEAEVAVVEEEESGRERLKRHRREVAGSVWIPETWEQEGLLNEWKDCAAFDRALIPAGLMSAREALVDECRRAAAAGIHVANS